MGIHKHPNSPYWHYKFTVNGRTVTGSTKTTNKTLARQFYEARKVDCLRNLHGMPVTKKMPLKGLTEEFLLWSKANKKSWDRDVIFVNHLLKFFGNKDISDITPFDIEKYKMHRVKKVTTTTVNKEVACLRRMYNLAIQWEKANSNPVKSVRKLKEPKRTPRWWTEDEVRKFLDACNERMKNITLVGINTGMRIGEILGLRWSQIDFDNKYITVAEPKNGEDRKVRMNDIVLDVLKKIEQKNDYIFSHDNGKRIKRVIKGFKSTAIRAEIDPSSPHVMRHTFASHLTMLGVDPHTIMELAGWKSLEMVMRYSHLAPNHKQKAVEKLSERFKNCITNANSHRSK